MPKSFLIIFQAIAVKSTTFYKLFTTYVNLALRQMVTSVLIHCAKNMGIKVQNMNHIK